MTLSSLRRGALLLVASALVAGPVVVARPSLAAGTTGCVGAPACVHITFPDGTHAPVDVPESEIAANLDIERTTYEIRAANGTDYDETISALSLRSLLDSVIPDPINPDSITYTLTNLQGSGYESPLHAGDLADPSPFAGGLQPAFAVHGIGGQASIEYLRPLRDDSDVNAPDDLQTGSSITNLYLQVHTRGALLHPTVSIDGSGQRQAGDAVAFTASPGAGDPPITSATYEWTYAVGDPPVPGGRSTSTVYASAGSYTVSVAVTAPAPDGGTYYGQSPGVSVQIGTAATPTPTTGPSGDGGSTSTPAPGNGPTSGSGRHAGSHPSGSVSGGAGASGERSTVGAGTPATASPAPANEATAQPAVGPTVPTATSPSGAGQSHVGPDSAGQDGTGQDSVIRGILIAGPAGAFAQLPADAATRAAASSRRPSSLTGTLDARWLWLLAPVVLFTAGALGEDRRLRRPRPSRLRRSRPSRLRRPRPKRAQR